MSNNCAVILAAGEGKRMKSAKPKVLCEVLFKPMLDWVIDSAKGSVADICTVIGSGGDMVKEHLGDHCDTVVQKERLGTGHAVMQAADFIAAHTAANVLVLCGDAPLMDSSTISSALEYHCKNSNDVTVISANLENPTGYGRIIRNNAGFLQRIVEQKDTNDEERAVCEVNSGAYWFHATKLLEILPQIKSNNAQGEFYLTDAIGIIIARGQRAAAFTAESPDVVMGANDRIQLLELNRRAAAAQLRHHMLHGVEVVSADGVVIGPDVQIGEQTAILPGTIIRGKTIIGRGCEIGPNTVIDGSEIGDSCVIPQSSCKNAKIAADTIFSPFSSI